MTKFEFIQEAALRILSACPEYPSGSIGDKAAELADEVWTHEDRQEPAQEHEPEILKCFSNEEPIKDLIDEVDRLDIVDKKRLTEEYRQRYSWSRNYTAQKSGYAVKLRNVCDKNDIKTIPELLNFGRRKFAAQYCVGKKLCDAVDKALENLYDIKSW